MKKIILFVLLSILISSCYEKKTTFKCKSSVDNDYYYVTIDKKEVDKSTFTCLDAGYTKDKKNVYFHNEKIIEDSPLSTKLLKYDSEYVQDEDKVYLNGKLILSGVDNKSFRILKHGYTMDKNNIYFQDKKLENIDNESFEVMWYGYAKDKNKVYYYGEELREADSDTFAGIHFSYSRDKDTTYYETKKVEGADPKTLEFFDFPFYIKDKNNVYYKDKILKEADSKSIKDNNEGKYIKKYLIYKIYYDLEDRNNYYKDGKIIKKK